MKTLLENNIPKIIWIYWDQGWHKAPRLIKECAKSWQHHNKDWEIRCLDKKTVCKYFDIEQWIPGTELKPKFLKPIRRWLHKKLHSTQLIKNKKLKVQNKSDIIRINLLDRYGGVWVDATLFCRQPLNQWITPHIGQSFFAFSNPGKNLSLKDGSLPIFTNYFLIAKKGNYIINQLNQSMQKYWQERDCMDQYLWMFALFNDLYSEDKKIANAWDKMIKIDAPIPNKGSFDKKGGIEFFAYQTEEQLNDLSQRYKDMLKNSPAPMFKLSNKKIYDPHHSSCINYLIFTSGEK